MSDDLEWNSVMLGVFWVTGFGGRTGFGLRVTWSEGRTWGGIDIPSLRWRILFRGQKGRVFRIPLLTFHPIGFYLRKKKP